MYKIFKKLLEINNVTPYRVAKETGISTATLTQWKNGISTPKQDKLQKIADYFNVSLEYLLTGKEKDSTEFVYYLNEDAAETAQEIFEKDKILFDVYNSSKKEQLVAFAKKLEELRKMEEGDL